MIKSYFVYNNQNVITQFVRCSTNEINKYGEKYIEVDFNNFVFDPNFIYRVENGGVIKNERTDEQYIYIKNKEDRNNRVKDIKVTHNGIVYQGDEESQNRISRHIMSLDESETIQWKSADNSAICLTKSDLIKILALATKKQTELWF